MTGDTKIVTERKSSFLRKHLDHSCHSLLDSTKIVLESQQFATALQAATVQRHIVL